MRNTIRCCISCILPCGALDVIRIVHSNGRVEEITGTIRAEEVMKAHPKHILKKPTSRPTAEAEALESSVGPTIVVVPPDAQLQRGKIYFLIPIHDQNSSTKKKNMTSSRKSSSSSSPSISSGGSLSSSTSTARRKRRDHSKSIISNSISFDGDKYLSDILSEKVISSHKDKRRGRVAVWRPHLESIYETLSEAASSDQ